MYKWNWFKENEFNFLYILLFAAITFLLIIGIQFIYRLLSKKSRKNRTTTEPEGPVTNEKRS